MSSQTFFFTVGLIFTTVGTLHIVRAALKWSLLINGWPFPVWGSWVIGVILILLAIRAWTHGIRTKRSQV